MNNKIITIGGSVVFLAFISICVLQNAKQIQSALQVQLTKELTVAGLQPKQVIVNGRNASVILNKSEQQTEKLARTAMLKIEGLRALDISFISDANANSQNSMSTNANQSDIDLQQSLDTLLSNRTIEFLPNSTLFSQNGQIILEQVALLIQQHPDRHIEIQAYTDSKGSAKKNLLLSQLRADAILNYIKKFELDHSRIHAVGYGDPLYSTGNRQARLRGDAHHIVFNVREK